MFNNNRNNNNSSNRTVRLTVNGNYLLIHIDVNWVKIQHWWPELNFAREIRAPMTVYLDNIILNIIAITIIFLFSATPITPPPRPHCFNFYPYIYIQFQHFSNINITSPSAPSTGKLLCKLYTCIHHCKILSKYPSTIN